MFNRKLLKSSYFTLIVGILLIVLLHLWMDSNKISLIGGALPAYMTGSTCGRGTVVFQNINGGYLEFSRTSGSEAKFVDKLSKECSFLIQKPLFAGGGFTDYATRKILPCSIESAAHHGHYVVIKNDKEDGIMKG